MPKEEKCSLPVHIGSKYKKSRFGGTIYIQIVCYIVTNERPALVVAAGFSIGRGRLYR
jgi:hypothetical protein